jgi:hypothetical protein
MAQVFLQPASSTAAQRHYSNTIMQPVKTTRVVPYLTPNQKAELHEQLEKPALRIWGVAPGKRGTGGQLWQRLQPGDIGLFAKTGRYFAKCRLTGKVQSPALARHLWPSTEGTQTWEYIYFVDEVRAIDIPYLEFNRATDSDPERVPLGFAILNPEQGAAAIAAFQL